MSIHEQVDDAIFLKKHGRYIGALTMLLLAVAASSRRTFREGTKSIEKPAEEMSDREAFTLFLGGQIRTVLFKQPNINNSGISLPFRGKQYDLEYILYKFYRCELVHDGELPEDVKFGTPTGGTKGSLIFSSQNQNVSINIGGNTMILDYGWIDLLVKAVVDARCNGPEFGIKHYDLVPLPGIDEQAFLEDLVAKYNTSPGRVSILKYAAQKISPVSIIGETSENIDVQFQRLVESGEINGGAITGLARHGFTDSTGKLLARGIALLRDVASGYKIVEV